MTRPIGYYVHHHGAGHRQRALTIAAHAGGRITLLGTGLAGATGKIDCIDLPDDRREGDDFDGEDRSPSRPPALHYAPVDHEGVRRRVALMTRWIADARPSAMVVDVSCEVAMLARLASVPTVYVRLSGIRDDRPHRDAYEAAVGLLAPFAAALDDPAITPRVRGKTAYFPGLGERFVAAAPDAQTVLVVIGRGGVAGDGELWARAARAMPDRRWNVIGPCSAPADLPANLHIHGWVDDAASRIMRAGVVIGGAGDGLIGSVLTSRRPFICVPEQRPFSEQRSKAEQLEANGAAVLCRDPERADWRQLIAAAEGLDPGACERLDDPDGARRAADYLIALAEGAGA